MFSAAGIGRNQLVLGGIIMEHNPIVCRPFFRVFPPDRFVMSYNYVFKKNQDLYGLYQWIHQFFSSGFLLVFCQHLSNHSHSQTNSRMLKSRYIKTLSTGKQWWLSIIPTTNIPSLVIVGLRTAAAKQNVHDRLFCVSLEINSRNFLTTIYTNHSYWKVISTIFICQPNWPITNQKC